MFESGGSRPVRDAVDTCPPSAPFEHPPPAGFEYRPATDEMIDAVRTAGSLDLDRDDIAMRQVMKARRLVATAAVARQYLSEQESAALGDAAAAAVSKERGVSVVPRDVELGSGQATLIEIAPGTFSLLALTDCRLLVIRGPDERILRRIGAHLLAAG